jgi:hypothetical protein
MIEHPERFNELVEAFVQRHGDRRFLSSCDVGGDKKHEPGVIFVWFGLTPFRTLMHHRKASTSLGEASART